MRKADELREAARRIGARQERERSTASTVAPAVLTERVRRTVDLSPVAHRGLTQWCAETAEMAGVARVTGQSVLSSLVDELLSDPALAERIRNRLQES